MAYNNGFPISYPQYYPPQQMQQPMPQPQMQPPQVPQQTAQSGLIWVQGEAGAKSYLVAPNTTVQLWDSEAPVIYLKSADQSGMPTMKILDYKQRDQAQGQPGIAPQMPDRDYVTHDELKDLEDRLLRRFDDYSVKAGKDHEHKSGSNNRNAATNKV